MTPNTNTQTTTLNQLRVTIRSGRSSRSEFTFSIEKRDGSTDKMTFFRGLGIGHGGERGGVDCWSGRGCGSEELTSEEEGFVAVSFGGCGVG